MGWEFIYLIIAIALSVALSFINKPPKPPNAQPREFEAPSSEEGIPIRVIFGSVLVKSPNIAWYGDLRTVPIRSAGRSGK